MSTYPIRIALTGKKGVGKDTFAKVLTSYATFYTLSFAKPLKIGLANMFDVHIKYFEDPVLKERNLPGFSFTPRQAMQVIGTDAVRNHLDENAWCFLMRERLQAYHQHNVIITDLRMPNEYNLCKTYGFTVVRVISNVYGTAQDSHVTENQLIPCDVTLENEGSLADLHDEAKRLLGYIQRSSLYTPAKPI